MTKLTAQQIDDRVAQMLSHIERLLAAGEITQKQAEEAMQDLARWSAHHYARLPSVEAVNKIFDTLFGGGKK